MKENLSDYEQIRQSNIKRNEDYLKSIGLENVRKTRIDVALDVLDRNYKKARKTSSEVEVVPILRRSTRGNGTEEGKPVINYSEGNIRDEHGVTRADCDEDDDYSDMPEPLPLGEDSDCIRISAEELKFVIYASNTKHADMIKNAVSSSIHISCHAMSYHV